MKKPLQATLTTPPLVENVAAGSDDGWVVGGLSGRVVGGDPGAVVAVVGGGIGAIVTLGGGVCAEGAVGGGGFGLLGTGPRPREGTVDVELLVFGVVVVGVVLAVDEPDSNSVTTSWWATTEAGRSVTSAATMDVAVQTMAVDATVAASQSPVANNRGIGTYRACSPAQARELRKP